MPDPTFVHWTPEMLLLLRNNLTPDGHDLRFPVVFGFTLVSVPRLFSFSVVEDELQAPTVPRPQPPPGTGTSHA